MTILDAMKHHKITANKMIKLLQDGKIRGLEINPDGTLEIRPQFAFAYEIPSNAKSTEENCFKYLLLTLDNHKYIDNTILFRIDIPRYNAYLDTLESNGYISRIDINNNNHEIANYILTPNKGISKAHNVSKLNGKKLKNEFHFSLIENAQIGLINGSIG